MNITKQFERSFELAKERNWDKIYVAVDIHDTILKACYHEEETYEWVSEVAKVVLQLMTNAKDICLILWSSCYRDNALKYIEFFEDNGIRFDYFNENPECPSNDLANFDEKMYFNIGLDDRFGFEPTDWDDICTYLFEKGYSLHKKVNYLDMMEDE